MKELTPKIVEARHAGDYRIWLRFADGVEGEIDLEPELWGPIFEPLKDKAYSVSYTHLTLPTTPYV